MSEHQSIDLPIGTEQEVHVSAEVKKKIRVEEGKEKYTCKGCIFEMKEEGTCLQDVEALSKQPEYECTARYRADRKSVIFVEVKDESI